MLCALFSLLTYKLQLNLVIQLIMLKYRMNNSCKLSLSQTQGLRRCVEEIVFSYTYPRLDMEVKENHHQYMFRASELLIFFCLVMRLNDVYQVSKHMNHLLKAPFCIHPKTGTKPEQTSVLVY